MEHVSLLLQYVQSHPTASWTVGGIVALYVILANYKFKLTRDADARIEQISHHRDVRGQERAQSYRGVCRVR